MPPLTSTITIDAAAERVWDIVAHQFGRIGEWATVIPSSTTLTAPTAIDAAVLVEVPAGRVCHTGIRAIPQVTETIVEYDEDTKTLTYEATEGMPAFVTLARNTWQVAPLADQQTRVTYTGQLEVRGLFGLAARHLLLARVARDGQHLLDDLKHYAEHGVPSPRKQGDSVAAVGTRPTSRVVRTALRANAVFSLLSGMALLAGGWWWYPCVTLLGVAVAGFGLVVAGIAAAPADRLRRNAVAVIAADILWVAASAAVLSWIHVPIAAGLMIGVVAAVVAMLAGWQIVGLALIREDGLPRRP